MSTTRRKTDRQRAAPFAAALVITACTVTPQYEAMQDADVLAAQLATLYARSLSDSKPETLADIHLDHFATDPIVLPPDRAAIVGRAAVERFYHDAYRQIEIVDNTYRRLEIDVRGDTAIRRWIGTGVFRLSGESETIRGTQRYLEVLVREGRHWKILLHTWTPVPSNRPGG